MLNQIISYRDFQGLHQGRITDIFESEFEIDSKISLSKDQCYFYPSEISTDDLFFTNLPQNYSFDEPYQHLTFNHPNGQFKLSLEFQKKLYRDTPKGQPIHHFLYHNLESMVMDPESQRGNTFCFFCPYSKFLFVIDLSTNMLITFRHSTSHRVTKVLKNKEFQKAVKEENKITAQDQKDLIPIIKEEILSLGYKIGKTRSKAECFENHLLKITLRFTPSGLELGLTDQLSGRGLLHKPLNKILNLKEFIQSVEETLPAFIQQKQIPTICKAILDLNLGFELKGSLTDAGSQRLQNEALKITVMTAPKGIKLGLNSILRKKALKHVYCSEIPDLYKFIEDLQLSLEEENLRAA